MSFYTGHIAAASNRADLIFQVELTDPVTGSFVDLTGSLITVALRPVSQSLAKPALSGTNQDGHITIISTGTFQTEFTRAEMAQFAAGDVDIGITVLLNNGITYQIFAGQLPIVDGVVAA